MKDRRILLTIRRDGHPDMKVPLPHGRIDIGRAEENGIVLPDIAVSRRHARLAVTEQGVSVEDTGSGNGTWCADERIDSQVLRDGDAIRIGPFALVFTIPTAPRARTTRPFANPLFLLDEAPAAPPPSPPPAMAPPPPAASGFGPAEFELGPGKKRRRRRRSRKMNMSAGGRRGGFMQRNIGKLTGALLVFASFLFAIGFVRNNMPDPPPTDPGVLPVAPDDDPVVSEEARARRAQIDTLVQEGNALFSQQRYLDAIRKYEAVQRMHPSNATATKMGYIACELLVAQSLYETIARRDTTRTERGEVRESSLAKAANAISGKGSLRAARADLDEALGYFPEDEDLLAARQQVERERRNRDRWSDQNQRQKLLDRLEKLFAAAMDTLARGDDISAYAELEQVLAADSERETEWYWKAEEQQGVIKADRAKRGGQTFRSAVTAKRNGDYLSARSQLRETMRLDPFHASARRHLEEVQSKLDKLALQLWSEAEIYEQTNQSDLAIGKYHEVVKYSAETSAPLAQKAQARIDALMRR